MAFAPILGSPSANNVYVPDLDASGKLVIEFSGNTEWPVNRYTGTRKVKTMVGIYRFINPDVMMRLLSTAGNNFVWNDGADRPVPHDNNAEFSNLGYQCERFAPSASIGWLARDQADYDWVAHYGRQLAHQNMLNRAAQAIAEIDTVGNHLSDHVFTAATAAGTGGALLSASTLALGYIKKAFNFVGRLIVQKTGGRVKYHDLVAIMDPATAIAVGAADEVAQVLIQAPFSDKYIHGDDDNLNGMYGLPKRLFGIEICVDDTPYVSSRKGAATVTRSFVTPTNVIYFAAKPGTKQGPSDFNALTFLVYKDMAVQTFDDPKHERTDISVVDIWDAKLTCPLTAAKMTNISS